MRDSFRHPFIRATLFVGLLFHTFGAPQTMAQTFCEPQPIKAELMPDYSALAWRWAPIHYQDTDSSYPTGDYLSAIDFDGDWVADNNWDHQAYFLSQLKGVVYYSVAETPTHWLVIYAMFHPRDWTDLPTVIARSLKIGHENDMEGLLAVIAKAEGEPFGKLEGIVTVAHRDFYSFLPGGSALREGQETIDGTLIMEPDGGLLRPTTFQEAKGHGLKAWDGRGFPGGDGIRYVPRSGDGAVPESGNDREVAYELRNVFAEGGLWDHRNDPQTFAGWGSFRGNHGRMNAANPPWGWGDHDDGLPRGLMAMDPARLVLTYFDTRGGLDSCYIHQPYGLSKSSHDTLALP